jgi:hypothetical protein
VAFVPKKMNCGALVQTTQQASGRGHDRHDRPLAALLIRSIETEGEAKRQTLAKLVEMHRAAILANSGHVRPLYPAKKKTSATS